MVDNAWGVSIKQELMRRFTKSHGMQEPICY